MSKEWDQISVDDVRAAYRLFLGRQASEQEVSIWMGLKGLPDLRRAFLSSAEFAAAQKSTPPPGRLPRDLPTIDIEWQTDRATAERLLTHVQSTWTVLGKERPHWSVLSTDQFLPERIAENEKSFFASGASELTALQSLLVRHAVSNAAHILEYGCGVGRVTTHLAKAFPRVTACDISESHLELARKLVDGQKNVEFRLVENGEFGMKDSFDLWVSYIVLQHNPPPIIAMILKRMFKALAPGGHAIFQVPTYAVGYRFNLSDYLGKIPSEGAIEVHCLPQSVIFDLGEEAGCLPLEVREDTAMGPPAYWLSNTFVFRKRSSRLFRSSKVRS